MMLSLMGKIIISCKSLFFKKFCLTSFFKKKSASTSHLFRNWKATLGVGARSLIDGEVKSRSLWRAIKKDVKKLGLKVALFFQSQDISLTALVPFLALLIFLDTFRMGTSSQLYLRETRLSLSQVNILRW